MKSHKPSWLTIALSVVAGVLVYLNIATFGLPTAWQWLVTLGLSALAAFGITPITGPALQNVLHISHTAVLALASMLTTLSVGITQINMSHTAQGIIVGVIVIVQGVFFGTAPIPTPPVKAGAHRARR